MIGLEDVSVSYAGGVAALRAVSVLFERRDMTVLLGLSGAGKSTLLRCLNHLTVPTTGRVVADGVGELKSGRALREHRRRTAIVFQQHQLIGRYSALQNVLIGRIGYHPTWRTLFPFPRADRILALESLDRVGLIEKALVPVRTLSGGQQQRVGIARALAQRPDLILADEPVASLDPATAEHVLDQFRAIAKQDGIPAVVSLHQVEFARQFGDRIIGLSGGCIVFDGKPGELSDEALARIYARPASTAPATVTSPAYDARSEDQPLELETAP